MAGRIWIVIFALVGCGRMGFNDQSGPLPVGGNVPTAPDDPGTDGGVNLTDNAPTIGVVAAWGFDDLDSAGSMSTSGDQATCSGAECPTRVPGVLGMAASFDGTTSCLHVASLSTWTTPNVTLSAWVQIPDAMLADTMPVVTRDPDGCPSPGIQTSSSQVGFLFMGQDSIHYHAWTPGISGNMWHQLGVRFDGTTQSVFVDGICACSSQPLQQILFANDEFTIGCDTSQSAFTTGVIDEVRLYDRALADDEMASLYAVAGRIAPTPTACPASCEITTAGP